MNKSLLMVMAGIVVVAAGILAFLANWDIPAPSTMVEIVIPNDRFAR